MEYLGYHTPDRPLIADFDHLRGHCFLGGYGSGSDAPDREIAWCNTMLPKGRWKRRWTHMMLFSGDHVFLFLDEDDAFAFRMRWG